MSVEFDRIKPGDELYDCHSERMGNTTMSRMGVWLIRVIEIDVANARALISWNGNQPRWEGRSYFRQSKIRRNPPEWTYEGFRRGRVCYVCSARELEGHRDDCDHPRAIAKRKKAK